MEDGNENNVFGYIWMGRPVPESEDDLSHEEVVWLVSYSDPEMKEERLISRLGCGMAELTFDYGGERIPIRISFWEDGEDLKVHFRLGNCLDFNAIIFNPHTGKRGIEALFKELGREAVERHLERQRKYYEKIKKAQEEAGGSLIF